MVVKLDKVFHKGIMSRGFPVYISIHPFVFKFFCLSKKKKKIPFESVQKRGGHKESQKMC